MCRSILHGSLTKGGYDDIEDVMVLWELTCVSPNIIGLVRSCGFIEDVCYYGS